MFLHILFLIFLCSWKLTVKSELNASSKKFFLFFLFGFLHRKLCWLGLGCRTQLAILLNLNLNHGLPDESFYLAFDSCWWVVPPYNWPWTAWWVILPCLWLLLVSCLTLQLTMDCRRSHSTWPLTHADELSHLTADHGLPDEFFKQLTKKLSSFLKSNLIVRINYIICYFMFLCFWTINFKKLIFFGSGYQSFCCEKSHKY